MRSWSVSSIRLFQGCELAWRWKTSDIEPEFKPLPLVEGTVLHAVLAFHVQRMRDGKTRGADADHGVRPDVCRMPVPLAVQSLASRRPARARRASP